MHLSPKIDIVFKEIFGTQKNIEILSSFLSSVLKKEVKDITFINTELIKNYTIDKLSCLDINAIVENQSTNIKIQLKNEYGIEPKALYYWSQLYYGQLKETDSYLNLKKTICINILDFNYTNESNFHSKYVIMNEDTKNKILDDFEIHFIELKKVPNKNITDLLTAWAVFLNNPTNEELVNFEDVQKAKKELERISLDDKQCYLYEIRLKSLRDEISIIENVIIRMLKQNLPLEKIEKFTLVPIERIIKLKELSLKR